MKYHKNPMLKLSALALAMSGTSFSTLAQDAAAQEQDVERIAITGSRIIRDANIGSGAPIQSVSAEDIRSSGEFNISEVVNDIPALFSSTTTGTANSNNVGDAGLADGANVLNLRGLGANRTLVLVNGKRHVGGAQGSGAVDIGSVPTNLIRDVEVLTGGASAVYGADAVTGVVNFILKDDFEGFEFDAQAGTSSEGDASQFKISALFGESFDNDKGNVVISVEYGSNDGLKASDRGEEGLFVGTGRDWTNPAKRFQQGDIQASNMPNFAQYYSPSNDRSAFGLAVPETASDFIANYNSVFGTDPDLTQAELDFISAAAAAPQRAVLPGRTFPFTSGYGLINPGNAFTFDGFDPGTNIDLDGNGVPDCYDSATGYLSVFGSESSPLSPIGGCWTVLADGSVRPTQDGLVSSATQGFGGDSFNTIQRADSYLLIPEEKITVNLLTKYDINDDTQIYGSIKYSAQEVENNAQPTSFWDLLLGQPDNPYLPSFIQDTARATGGVSITIDPIMIGDGDTKNKRETFRVVGGIKGVLDNDFNYEISAVYGRFDLETTRNDSIINDRFLAAIDAVTDPATGEAACRSSVDPTTEAQTTPFNIPDYDPGYFSFTPGDGTCVPLNIWAGETGITQEAVDWVTVQERDKITLEQTIISASLAGDSSEYFELPAGSIAFAVGAEYRKEESEARFDPWQRGVIPEGAPFAAGTLLNTVSGNNKLTFRPATLTIDETGDYDVTEVFAELSVPLLEGAPGAEELTLDLAARYSDYSTIGTTTTWLARVVWAPYEDLRFRVNLSEAVRAPNITELFGPRTGTTFRPTDPCDAAQIQALRDGGQADLANSTQANCVAFFQGIGFDPTDGAGNYVFADPLTAAFGGITGGNPNLQEETAETTSYGFVFTPSFLEGFSLSIDYWDISIEDAINAVSGQNIVDGCYQANSLNPQFCALQTRNPENGGFNFIESVSINFAKRETSGYDFSLAYEFDIDAHEFEIKVGGTKVNELDDFTNPLDLTEVDPELGEIRRPELAGNVTLSWEYEGLRLSLQNQYVDEMLLGFLEIETAQSLYGDSVFQDEMWVHDLSFSYDIDESLQVYGGLNNITDEKPFITNYAYPVSAVGRYAFLGFNVKI